MSQVQTPRAQVLQAAEPARARTFGPQVPNEGDAGLYTQSWFPICMSDEVAPGKVIGAPFLGGRVVVFRGEDGVAQVTSAYCPHLGADLAVGEVVGNQLRCAYHLWEFGREGSCLKTGCGDPPPPHAALFSFPTIEKHGLVWAFNGTKPWFDLPEWPYPAETLCTDTQNFPVPLHVDPWVICAQTPDIQHVVLLHKFDISGENPAKAVEWTNHSMFYQLDGAWKGRRMDVRAGIVGTSMYFQTGTLDGRWFGFMTAMGLAGPRDTRLFSVFAAQRSNDEAGDKAFLQDARQHELDIAMEDAQIGQTIRFKVGSLTRSDSTLARFLQYVRTFPRAHPSVEFIN